MNYFMLKFLMACVVIFCVIRENEEAKSSVEDIFSNYVRSTNLTFLNLDQRYKTFKIFQNNLALIDHINSQNLTYTAGINKFAHYVSNIIIYI
jgi:hypothetical protein